MTETRTEEFSEELLSGYLDGTLVQQDEQRVRVRLESSPDLQRLLDEMRQIREAAKATPFARPPDLQFSEKPRSGFSGFSRLLGGGLLAVWLAVTLGYGAWEMIRDEGPWLPKVLVFALFSGCGLLLLSVLLDRLKVAKDDRYRGVEK